MRSQVFLNALRILVTAIATMLATESIAAQFNLSGGESAVIQPNTATTVTCGRDGSGGGNCREAIQAFKSILDSCIATHYGDYCAKTHWPDYKRANPTCLYAGMAVCQQYCKKNNSSESYCSSICSPN